MEIINNINTYNYQTIITLNKHLISLKKLDDIFEYLSSYLKNDLSINKIIISVNNNQLFSNFEYDKSLIQKETLIRLNINDELKVSIFYNKNETQNIPLIFPLVEMIFNIISQTIYNKYLEYKIKELTLKDSLTGLYNREYINEYLKSILPLSKREEKKIAFLKVGIDHFKAVIDEFDYAIGDKVLKQLANSLEQVVRKSDIVARIESDEFLIVLHNISNENNAIIIADKIINNFKNKKVIVNKETNQILMKTICTGISIYPDDAQKADEIFKSADIALYEAKNKGRSQYFKFQKKAENIQLF